MLEVFGGLLTADAVMAVEDDQRRGIFLEQLVVICLVEQARAIDGRQRALVVGAHVDELERRAAVDQRLELLSRELSNHRSSRGLSAPRSLSASDPNDPDEDESWRAA